MSATADHLSDPELLATEWDLAALLDGTSVRALLDEAGERAAAFARRYAGRIAQLDADGLREAMRELEAINELIGRAGSYVSLRFATDTADPERGAALQLVQERATEAETRLLFFELEWAALDDERAEALLAADGLGLLPPLPAQRPPLPPPPALRERGEGAWPRRPSPARARGRGCSASCARRSASTSTAASCRSTSPWPGCSPPTARRGAPPPRRSRRRWSPACAPAASSTTRSPTTSPSRTACATTRTGWPAATWPTRPPTSRSWP